MTGHSETITELQRFWRARRFAMTNQLRMSSALTSYVRLNFTSWQFDLPAAERVKHNKEAARLIKAARKGEGDSVLCAIVAASDATAGPLDTMRAATEKEIAKLAATFPAWEAFGKAVRGFGVASLGAIVAEAGDLSNYPTHSHLWKRLGLAVIDGKRQGAAGEFAAKEVWIEHGYSPRRRSVMWNIGDALLKQNDGVYRAAYDRRKAYELARSPEMRPAHAHARATRYMTKHLVKHLWQVWTGRLAFGILPAKALPRLPADPSTRELETV